MQLTVLRILSFERHAFAMLLMRHTECICTFYLFRCVFNCDIKSLFHVHLNRVDKSHVALHEIINLIVVVCKIFRATCTFADVMWLRMKRYLRQRVVCGAAIVCRLPRKMSIDWPALMHLNRQLLAIVQCSYAMRMSVVDVDMARPLLFHHHYFQQCTFQKWAKCWIRLMRAFRPWSFNHCII